jgi:predicted enzyme involved in methoxymalonyl-ACP biosynthesis
MMSFYNCAMTIAFKRKRFTKEDLAKNEQYIAEQQRNNAKESVHSFEEYVESLAIKLDISINNPADTATVITINRENKTEFNFNKEAFSIRNGKVCVRGEPGFCLRGIRQIWGIMD